MSADWIKVRTVLPTDGRLRIASRLCHVSTVTAFGALVTVWCLADSHADENGVLIGYTKDDIDALVGVPGYCDALPRDWIDLSGEFVKLPDYQEHNGTSGKARAQAAKRQRRHRDETEPSRSKRDTTVTREEKRREEEKTPAKAGPISLDAFIEKCEALGELPIPADDPVYGYAEKAGIPIDYLPLAWGWFKSAMAGKRKTDWRAHFRNAVRGNWPKFWYAVDGGGYALTTAGKQAARASA